MSETTIAAVKGRRVWDSRGRPTVEVEVTLGGGATGRAIAPAGSSTGSGEAVDLRDGGDGFGGYDVFKAVGAVNGDIAAALSGLDANEQETVDRALIDCDGTPNKARLGGNAIVATSMATARAAAAAAGLSLWRYLGGDESSCLPLPEIQILGGGAHAGRRVDIQDYMVIAVGAVDYAQALDWTAEVYRTAGALLAAQGRLQGLLTRAASGLPSIATRRVGVARAGNRGRRADAGTGRGISLDVAASEFGSGGRYRLAREDRVFDRDGMIKFTQAVGDRVEIVGDDYLVTNADRVGRRPTTAPATPFC